MIKLKYIIRLDDACEEMHHENWSIIENILDIYNIKPIVGVIPNNNDQKLKKDVFDENFWTKVKGWEQKEWCIALHGYKHIIYDVIDKQLVEFAKKSEFTGKSYQEQSLMFINSIKIFNENKIDPKIFMAPAHGFDDITLKALFDNTNIRIITDGLSISPYYFKKFIWIPQQLWNFKLLPFGVWTICLHPSTMNKGDLDNFEKSIKSYSNKNLFVNPSNYFNIKRNRNLFDILINYLMLKKIN